MLVPIYLLVVHSTQCTLLAQCAEGRTAQAQDDRSARLAAAQVLSPLFAQLSGMSGTAVPEPSAMEVEPLLATAEQRTDDTVEAHQAVYTLAEQQVVPAVPLVNPQSVSKERPLWRRAAVGCAPPPCASQLQTLLSQAARAMLCCYCSLAPAQACTP